MIFDIDTFDSHFHIYKWFNENGNSYMENLDDIKRRLSLKGLCLNALGDKVFGGAEQNIMVALYKLHDPTAFATGGFVYASYPVSEHFPDGMDVLTQYRELMDIGLDGIKLLYKPNVQKEIVLPISDKAYDGMFAQAERDGTYILWHLADPEFFWSVERKGRWAQGGYPSFEQMFRETFDVLDRHPRLNVTFAHFLFLSEHPEILESILNKYENVGVDITPGTEMYDTFTQRRDFYRAFFEKHADRLIFGTDADPFLETREQLISAVYKVLLTDESVEIWKHGAKGLELSRAACEKILSKNFHAKCGSAPKPINKRALVAYIEKYLPMVADGETKEQILSSYQFLIRSLSE